MKTRKCFRYHICLKHFCMKKNIFGPHEPQNSLFFKPNCLGHIFITLTSCYWVYIRYLTTFSHFVWLSRVKIFLKSKMISFAYRYFDMHCVSHFYLIVDIGTYPWTHVEKCMFMWTQFLLSKSLFYVPKTFFVQFV